MVSTLFMFRPLSKITNTKKQLSSDPDVMATVDGVWHKKFRPLVDRTNFGRGGKTAGLDPEFSAPAAVAPAAASNVVDLTDTTPLVDRTNFGHGGKTAGLDPEFLAAAAVVPAADSNVVDLVSSPGFVNLTSQQGPRKPEVPFRQETPPQRRRQKRSWSDNFF